MKTSIIVLDFSVRNGNVFIHFNVPIPDWENFDDWLMSHGYAPSSVEWMAGDLSITVVDEERESHE